MTATPETAVRRYLEYLADPESIVDHAHIASLEAQIAETTDVMQRLHLSATVDKARRADSEAVRADFVRHARDYAAANDLPISAFRAVGVSDIALAEAGFDLGFGTRSGSRARSAVKAVKATAAGRQRAPKVAKASIRDHVLGREGPFTLNDIARDAGGSTGTVNAVVQELIAQNLLASAGPDPDHKGRGRAPLRYQRLSR